MIFSALLSLAAAASDMPYFSFREHNTQGQYNLDSLRKAKCKDTPEGIACSQTGEVAGHWATMAFLVVDLRLSQFSISGFRESIPDVLSALEAKYGAPCDSGKETVTNGYGGQFSSTTLTWCFRTGKMVFKERSSRIDSWSATYHDDLIRPKVRQVRPDF